MVIVPSAHSGGGETTVRHSSDAPCVLVIEQQPLFRAALGRLLSAPPIGAQIQFADDSESGLELTRGGGIDLVFCDIDVAPICARQLVKELSSLDPPIPVIVLGDREDEMPMTAALHARAAGLFTKDCSPDEFLVGVGAVLSGHRAVGATVMGWVSDQLKVNPRRARRPAGSAPRKSTAT